jgi:hypothetical protein
MADDLFDERLSREIGDTGVELKRIGDLADGVGRSLSRALRGAVMDGRSLNSVLGEIARSFTDIALKAAFKPLGMLAENAVDALFTSTNPALRPFAKGGVSRGADVLSHAGRDGTDGRSGARGDPAIEARAGRIARRRRGRRGGERDVQRDGERCAELRCLGGRGERDAAARGEARSTGELAAHAAQPQPRLSPFCQ